MCEPLIERKTYMTLLEEIHQHPWMFIGILVQIVVLFNIIRLTFKQSGKVANIRTFIVKGSFSFQTEEGQVATCTYYHENLIKEEARDLGVDYSEFLTNHAPNFEFETKPLSKQIQTDYCLPYKMAASKESIETKDKLVMTHPAARCIFVMLKPAGFNPYETYWIGTCIQTDTDQSFNQIVKQYRKQSKC